MPYAKNSELPPSVKNSLPDAAQTIFRKAYNSALEQYDGDEERASRVAWSAVKNVYKKDGDKWVTKDAATYDFSEHLLLDAKDIRMTKDGYLVANPRVARTGIQIYPGWQVGRPELDKVSVYRPEASVMDKKSLASLAHKPITLGHPPEMVNANNWDEYSVGHSSDEIVRDGEFVRIPLVVMDQSGINRIKDGHEQLSVGYYADVEWVDGKTDAGESYQAIQKNIQANHIAIVPQARGGPKLRLGDINMETGEGDFEMPKIITVDGLNVTLDERDAAIVTRHIQKLEDDNKKLAGELVTITTQRDDNKKLVDTKDGELAVLKKKVEDEKITPQMLDAKVTERVDIITKARKVLGDKFDPAGKTNIDIQKLVVASKLGDAAKAMNDGAISGAFEAVTLDAKPDGNSNGNNGTGVGIRDLANALGTRLPQNMREVADQAWDKRGEYLKDAYLYPNGRPQQPTT